MSWFLESLPTSYSSLHLFFPSHFSSFSTCFLFISFFIIQQLHLRRTFLVLLLLHFFLLLLSAGPERNWVNEVAATMFRASQLVGELSPQPEEAAGASMAIRARLQCHSPQLSQPSGKSKHPRKEQLKHGRKFPCPASKRALENIFCQNTQQKTQKTCHKYTRFPCPT